MLDGVESRAVTTKAGLLSLGLRGFTAVRDLLDKGLPPQTSKLRVYAVVAPPGYKPVFVPPEEVRTRGNVLRPWPVHRLCGKWVLSVETVYIGLAGVRSSRTLAGRLRELLRHASGHTSRNGPHKGGDILWQLEGFEEFEVGYLPTGGPPAPREWERALLRAFIQATGKLPFANRKW